MVTMVEEGFLDPVIGLSGSGPGFIEALAHSMTEGGVRAGPPREVAYKLALQTITLQMGPSNAQLDNVTTTAYQMACRPQKCATEPRVRVTQ